MNKDKNLLIIIPSLNIGGTETQVTLLVKELITLEYNVKVLVRKGLYNSEIPDFLLKRIIEIPNLPGFHPLLLISLFKIIKSEKKIVIFSYLDQMNIAVGLLSFFLNFKWYSSERSNPHFHNSLYQKFSRFLMRNSEVLVNNKLAFDYYLKNKYKVTIINNFLKYFNFSTEKISLKKNYYIFSRFSASKNIDFVLLAWEQANIDANLYLIGHGPLTNYLKEYINSKELKNVFIKNDVTQETILNDYNFFISASLYEGVSNSALEALCLNNLLILSKIPGHIELVNNLNICLFNLDDIKDLVSKLITTNKFNIDQYLNLLNQQKEILKDFDNENLLKKYLKLLN